MIILELGIVIADSGKKMKSGAREGGDGFLTVFVLIIGHFLL